MTATETKHYIVVRTELGGNSGPGNGWAGVDRVQVMAASRTLAGAKRHQSRLGGRIEEVNEPYRKYERNETIR
jgi:hypothetical protein